jgi:hypothetical protein
LSVKDSPDSENPRSSHEHPEDFPPYDDMPHSTQMNDQVDHGEGMSSDVSVGSSQPHPTPSGLSSNSGQHSGTNEKSGMDITPFDLPPTDGHSSSLQIDHPAALVEVPPADAHRESAAFPLQPDDSSLNDSSHGTDGLPLGSIKHHQPDHHPLKSGSEPSESVGGPTPRRESHLQQIIDTPPSHPPRPRSKTQKSQTSPAAVANLVPEQVSEASGPVANIVNSIPVKHVKPRRSGLARLRNPRLKGPRVPVMHPKEEHLHEPESEQTRQSAQDIVDLIRSFHEELRRLRMQQACSTAGE